MVDGRVGLMAQDANLTTQVVDVSTSGQIGPYIFAEEEEKLIASTEVADDVLDSVHLTVAFSCAPESADVLLENAQKKN